jgi:DNA-binding beta-propeller fold protein YncE
MNKRMVFESLVLLAVAASPVFAQSGVAGPISGYVFDRSASVLRPILGIPGASLLGAGLDAGSQLTAAYVAPGQNWVLAATADGPVFLRLTGGAISRIPVNGVTASPERVAFSPSGTAVALYAAGRIQVVEGLPDAPRVTGALATGVSARSSQESAAARSRRGVGSFAVSDDGLYVLYADGGSIRLWGAGGENFTVIEADSNAIVAFAPGGHKAAVADPTGGVQLLGDVAGAGSRRSLAAASMAYPVGLAFSADGGKLFLADAGARQVTAYDLAAGAQTVTSCDCVPAGLFAMGGLFRLNDAGAAPLWLLDARSGDPRIVFVPARSE